MVYYENLDFGAAGSEMPVNFSDWHLHIQGDAHSRSFNPNIPSNVNMNGRYDAVLDTPEGVSVAVTVPKKMIIEKNQELSCNRLMAGIPSRHDTPQSLRNPFQRRVKCPNPKRSSCEPFQDDMKYVHADLHAGSSPDRYPNDFENTPENSNDFTPENSDDGDAIFQRKMSHFDCGDMMSRRDKSVQDFSLSNTVKRIFRPNSYQPNTTESQDDDQSPARPAGKEVSIYKPQQGFNPKRMSDKAPLSAVESTAQKAEALKHSPRKPFQSLGHDHEKAAREPHSFGKQPHHSGSSLNNSGSAQGISSALAEGFLGERGIFEAQDYMSKKWYPVVIARYSDRIGSAVVEVMDRKGAVMWTWFCHPLSQIKVTKNRTHQLEQNLRMHRMTKGQTAATKHEAHITKARRASIDAFEFSPSTTEDQAQRLRWRRLKMKMATIERKTSFRAWLHAAAILFLLFSTALFGLAVFLLVVTEGERAMHTLARLWNRHFLGTFNYTMYLMWHSMPSFKMLHMPLIIQHAKHNIHQNLCKITPEEWVYDFGCAVSQYTPMQIVTRFVLGFGVFGYALLF